MAILLTNSDTLILLVPKTGSTWIRTVLERSGIPHRHVGDRMYRGHGNLLVHGRKNRAVACFVREPYAWYRSYWAHRTHLGWRPKYLIDRHCSNGDFGGFLAGCVRTFPGFLTTLFEEYAGSRTHAIEFVGRQESLADDLIRLLHSSGESFSEAHMRRTQRINESPPGGTCPEDVREMMCIAELSSILRFGYTSHYSRFLGAIRIEEILKRYSQDATFLLRLILGTQAAHLECDQRRLAIGKPVQPATRWTRLLGNFAFYAAWVRGETDYAQGLFEDALGNDPTHPRTLHNYAMLHRYLGNLRIAQRLLRRALQCRPNHLLTLRSLARTKGHRKSGEIVTDRVT